MDEIPLSNLSEIDITIPGPEEVLTYNISKRRRISANQYLTDDSD